MHFNSQRDGPSVRNIGDALIRKPDHSAAQSQHCPMHRNTSVYADQYAVAGDLRQRILALGRGAELFVWYLLRLWRLMVDAGPLLQGPGQKAARQKATRPFPLIQHHQ